jgi:hypothetical protein
MPIIRSSRLYVCYYRLWCAMPWMLVVGGQVQGSRLCIQNEGCCSTSRATSRNMYMRMPYLEIIKLTARNASFFKPMEEDHTMFYFKLKQMSSVSRCSIRIIKYTKSLAGFEKGNACHSDMCLLQEVTNFCLLHN